MTWPWAFIIVFGPWALGMFLIGVGLIWHSALRSKNLADEVKSMVERSKTA